MKPSSPRFVAALLLWFFLDGVAPQGNIMNSTAGDGMGMNPPANNANATMGAGGGGGAMMDGGGGISGAGVNTDPFADVCTGTASMAEVDCMACVENNCTWYGQGRCTNNCSFVPGTPCYDQAAYPGESAQAICTIQARDVQELSHCQLAGAGGCATCVATPFLSNANKSCVWYQMRQECRIGECFFQGCGSDTCPPTNPPAPAPGTAAPSPGAVPVGAGGDMMTTPIPDPGFDCPAFPPDGMEAPTCETCIEANCSWTIDNCYSYCAVADALCYNQQNFAGQTITEICAAYTSGVENSARCSTALNCSTCIATPWVDGSQNCQWYPDADVCDTGGCGIVGCGESTCSDTSTPAANEFFCPGTDNSTTCNDCINAGCAWFGAGSCLTGCDVGSGQCYSLEQGVDAVLTTDQICTSYETDLANNQACGVATDCTTCVATVQTDGNSTCEWDPSDKTCLGSGIVVGVEGCEDMEEMTVGAGDDMAVNLTIPCTTSTDCPEDMFCASKTGFCTMLNCTNWIADVPDGNISYSEAPCVGEGAEEGVAFCGSDGMCYEYGCQNWYKFGPAEYTGYDPANPVELTCAEYDKGEEEDLNSVVFGCRPYNPGFRAPKAKTWTFFFNYECKSTPRGSDEFKCYQNIPTTDYRDYLGEVSRINQASCDREIYENEQPLYWYIVQARQVRAGETQNYKQGRPNTKSGPSFDQSEAQRTMFSVIVSQDPIGPATDYDPNNPDSGAMGVGSRVALWMGLVALVLSLVF